MKKLTLGLLICTFVASPVFASDFKVEQKMLLSSIAAELHTFKGDTLKVDFLTKTKACVEEAVDIAGLNECVVKPKSAQQKSIK